MERAENVYVIPADFSWSDLGTWASLYDNKEKDELGNVHSKGNVQLIDTRDSLVYVDRNDKLVVVQDMEDLIVIDTEDVLLVCDRRNEQKVKETVAELSNKGFTDYL